MNGCFFQHFSKIYNKILVFVLTLEISFSQKFHFKRNWKRNFESFQYFNFETNLWKTQTPFKKLEYRFLVESTKIDNATFPCKTALMYQLVLFEGDFSLWVPSFYLKIRSVVNITKNANSIWFSRLSDIVSSIIFPMM